MNHSRSNLPGASLSASYYQREADRLRVAFAAVNRRGRMAEEAPALAGDLAGLYGQALSIAEQATAELAAAERRIEHQAAEEARDADRCPTCSHVLEPDGACAVCREAVGS